MKIIFIVILVYLAYQFVFNFLIPVYITSRRIRKGFREMQARMQSYQSTTNQQEFASSSYKPAAKSASDDYIDFEEVK